MARGRGPARFVGSTDGSEPPAQRKDAGKPEVGVVRVEASHRAGTLVITVGDDGNGIDLQRLRAKVVERGLTTADPRTRPCCWDWCCCWLSTIHKILR